MTQVLDKEVRPDIYLPRPANVLEATQVTETEMFFKFAMADDQPLGYMPGQFMEVSVPGIGEAPISISSSPTRCRPISLCTAWVALLG